MNEGKNGFLISLIFLLSSFIFLLSSKLLTSLLLKKFDSLYLKKIDNDGIFKRRENYVHYNKYKSLAFSVLPSLILNILEILLTLFIFSFGEPYFFLGLGSSIIFSLLLYFAFSIKENALNEKASRVEYSYCHFNKIKNDRLLDLSYLVKLSKKYSIFLTLKESISVIYAVLVSLLVIYFKSDFSMESFFFTSISNYLMIGLVKQALTNYDKIDEKKKEESYFVFNFLV